MLNRQSGALAPIMARWSSLVLRGSRFDVCSDSSQNAIEVADLGHVVRYSDSHREYASTSIIGTVPLN